MDIRWSIKRRGSQERIGQEHTQIMQDESELRKAKLDLLTKEYDHRFSEIMFHSERYHKQINFLQIYIAVLTAIGGALLSDSATAFLERLDLDPAQLKIGSFVFLMSGISVAFYLFSNVLDALFMMYINGGRIASIEQKINVEVDDPKLLIWDTKIIPALYRLDFVRTNAWIRPQYLVATWSFFIFLTIAAILTGLCWILLPGIFWFYSLGVLLLTGFHLWQVIALNTKSVKDQINEKILSLSESEPSNNDLSDSDKTPIAGENTESDETLQDKGEER